MYNKNFYSVNLLIRLLIPLFFVACAAEVKKTVTPPPEENVKVYYGKAVITGITDSGDTSAADKRGYMEIYFDYFPDDPGALKKYLCTGCPDTGKKLFYDNRENFHANWIKKWDIKQGNAYSAIRREELKNGRPDVSYEVFLEQRR